METTDIISIAALLVALLGGIINYFYTRKQFSLATKPALWFDLMIEKNYDGSIYHTIAHHYLGVYRIHNFNRLTYKIKNLSTTLSITDISIKTQYSQPLSRLFHLGHKWHDLSYDLKIGTDLNPLEEKSNNDSNWDYIVANIFPDIMNLVITEDNEGIRYARYTVKSEIKFFLRLIIKYRAGISNSPEYEYIYNCDIFSHELMSQQEKGVFWITSKNKKGRWTV